jgi:hypothetical protein
MSDLVRERPREWFVVAVDLSSYKPVILVILVAVPGNG